VGVGSRGKDPGRPMGFGGFASVADDFVEICYFCHGLNKTATFAFIAYKCSIIYNRRRVNLEAEKLKL